MAYNATSGKFEGCYTLSHTVSGGVVVRAGLPCNPSPVHCQIQYYLDPTTNPAGLAAFYPACDSTNYPPIGSASCPRGTGWSIESSATATSATETCPLDSALLWQANLVLPSASVTSYVGVLVNGTVTVSE
jgi:hypothetical protein